MILQPNHGELAATIKNEYTLYYLSCNINEISGRYILFLYQKKTYLVCLLQYATATSRAALIEAVAIRSFA